LPAFEQLLPPLVRAYDALPAGGSRRSPARPHAAAWDLRYGVASVATTVADAYGTEVLAAVGGGARRRG
jgi:acyl-homoserine-lactone acylase